jgi:hypothetical protein
MGISGLITLAAIIFTALLLAYFRSGIRVKALIDQDYQTFRDTVATIPVPLPISTTAPAPALQEPPAPIIDTMAQFQTAYNIVRRHEGGFQIMPEDSGNYNSRLQLVGTNWGINAQVYENYLKRPPTEQDMRNMPHYIALALYKNIYWDSIKGDEIRDQQVANIFFDGHVNHGSWGVKMMQQALGVARDGNVGPITLAAINAKNGFTLFNKYKKIRRAGYIDLARRRPKDQRFLRGWLLRIDSFYYGGGGGSSSSSGGSSSGGGIELVAGLVMVVTFLTLK